MAATAARKNKYGNHRLLSADEEKALAKKIEMGDNTARDMMIQSNLRLAMSIANKYRQLGYSMDDIIQEGNIGLIKAVDRFDWRKGFRFSTYACWWIKQAIRRYLASQGHVKFPAGSRHLIWKINNARKEYEEEFGNLPTNAEIADLLGIKEKLVSDLRTGMQWPININTPIGDGTRTWADIIPDDNSPDIDMKLDKELIMGLIKKGFQTLKPQEEKVLRLRFGISEDDDNVKDFPPTKLS